MARRRRHSAASSRRRRGRRRSYRRNPFPFAFGRKRRRSRRRRNPVLPTGIIGQAFWLGAGYVAAPIISRAVPFEPASRIGQYVKQGLVVFIGSALVGRFVGRKFGNALLAGGMVNVAVQVLQDYVPAFGGGGVGAYFPPDDTLGLAPGDAACPPGLDVMTAGSVGRFNSRFGE